MEEVIRSLEGVDKSLRRSRIVVVAALCASAVISVGAVAASLWYVNANNSKVYVLDQGHSLLALRADNIETRDDEIRDHIRMFHMLFLNQAPNKEAIERNLNSAFLLCDGSAHKYYKAISEKGFYRDMVQFNVMQQAVVDDVQVDTSVYPYYAVCKVTYYLIYEKRMVKYRFESHCHLVNTERSDTNTHGLMMERFVVDVNEPVAETAR